ncbi:MAG: ABC-type Mn/Zn transport systems, ATPase component [uncultured Acidimicrobiales bacterium]|uniref:ABC-type Mn/Zn transport systems, ATPase component n=1 Tax=uncultured Acidimicrobiales bacterium TaxID=310071 RepID=A0A6J4INF7_9ACTN|nr:MAG: ABC-type Mn/Zn transport systems, ATPase component [uncultured Acidimicrobiales bacterium]
MADTSTNTVARAMNDVGMAAWFGGSLMGAIGLNGAAAVADAPSQRAKVANAGWARWTPANLAAIAAYTVGALQLTRVNKDRLTAQKGVAAAAGVKTVLSGLAMGATAYSRVLGQKVMDAGAPSVEGATEPNAATPPEVAAAQRQLKMLQWAIPALTGAMIVIDSRMSEQQRPNQVARGLLSRIAT